MKRFHFFVIVFLFIGGVISINAQDLIVLRDGNIIEAKVEEISTTEIRYRRIDHLDGPIIVVSVENVLSIKYENGKLEKYNVATITENLNSNFLQYYDNELFKFTSLGIMFNNNRIVGPFGGMSNQSAINALSLYNESYQYYLSYKKYHTLFNIFYWGGLTGMLISPVLMIGGGYGENGMTYAGLGLFGIGTLSALIPGIIYLSKSQANLYDAINSFNRHKIIDFGNLTPTYRQKRINNVETNPTAIDSNKFTFGLSVNPAGFIPNAGGGPSITLDFTKGKFNSIIDIRSGFGFVPSFFGYELFGLGSIFNYYHPSRIGGFYIGGLIEYSLGKNITDDLIHRFGLAGNIGYKFITKSGMYFRTGFKGGYSFGEGNGTIVRPDLAFGYIF